MALIIGTPAADILAGTTEADDIRGLAGDDVLSGGAGDDRLDGGEGINTLDGGAGDDTLVITRDGGGSFQGGIGRDRLTVANLASPAAGFLAVDLAAGVIRSLATSHSTPGPVFGSLGGVEEVEGFLLVTGTEAAERIIGANQVMAAGGNDVIEVVATNRAQYFTLEGGIPRYLYEPAFVVDAGTGDDTVGYQRFSNSAGFSLALPSRLEGGDGTDLLSLAAFMVRDLPKGPLENYGVIVDLAAGTLSDSRARTTDVISGFENVSGTALDDVIRGDAGANGLAGGAGNDLISGGAGNDRLDGGDGFDILSLDGAPGAARVDLAAGVVQDGWSGTDAVTGFEAVRGTAQADVLLGSARAETLDGGAGDDIIDAGAGDDVLYGGPGNDRLEGGAGFDTLRMDQLGYRGSQRTLVGSMLQLDTAEGTDLLSGIEQLRFVDGVVTLLTEAQITVSRLYAGLLGRAPETDGLSYWTDRLAQGGTGVDIAQGIEASGEFAARHGALTDNGDFVRMLYAGALGRAPEASGLAYWQDALAAGASRGAVTAAFFESAEAKTHLLPGAETGIWQLDPDAAVVARLFDTVLGHAPDLISLTTRLAALETGTTFQNIATGLLISREYRDNFGNLDDQAFVGALYSTGLDRQVDADGLAFWSNQLAAGLSRAEVVYAISESAEHVALARPVIDDGILFA